MNKAETDHTFCRAMQGKKHARKDANSALGAISCGDETVAPSNTSTAEKAKKVLNQAKSPARRAARIAIGTAFSAVDLFDAQCPDHPH